MYGLKMAYYLTVQAIWGLLGDGFYHGDIRTLHKTVTICLSRVCLSVSTQLCGCFWCTTLKQCNMYMSGRFWCVPICDQCEPQFSYAI